MRDRGAVSRGPKSGKIQRVSEGLFRGDYTRRERTRRVIIMAIVVAVIYVPGIVAVAMILTGHAGG